MKSPFTGKEMKLIREERELTFRKEEFTYVHHAYQDEETGELFTTTELDELNIIQVYNQYREHNNIPFPEQIQKIREQYKVSARKMAQILGFGVNSYRNYENGEVPSVSNARLIQSAEDPREFLKLLDLCSILRQKEKNKYRKKAKSVIQEKKENREAIRITNYFLGKQRADRFTGYRQPNLEKFREMVAFFAQELSPFKTMMNKLLFYADFLNYKRSCYSISGIRYRAIQRGPVPYKFQGIFEYLIDGGYIDTENITFSQGYTGVKFICREGHNFNETLFTEEELKAMKKVVEVFKDKNASQISDLSHNESGWIENSSSKSPIDYNYAFELKQV